jgi:hypothetical protein
VSKVFQPTVWFGGADEEDEAKEVAPWAATGSGALTLGPFFFRVIASACPSLPQESRPKFELTALRTRVSKVEKNSTMRRKRADSGASTTRRSRTEGLCLFAVGFDAFAQFKRSSVGLLNSLWPALARM